MRCTASLSSAALTGLWPWCRSHAWKSSVTHRADLVAIVNRRRPHEIVDTVDRADVVVLADAVDVDAVDATVVHGSKLLRRPTKKPAQPAGFPSLGVLGRRGLSTGG
jgi:hypothetical protein